MLLVALNPSMRYGLADRTEFIMHCTEQTFEARWAYCSSVICALSLVHGSRFRADTVLRG